MICQMQGRFSEELIEMACAFYVKHEKRLRRIVSHIVRDIDQFLIDELMIDVVPYTIAFGMENYDLDSNSSFMSYMFRLIHRRVGAYFHRYMKRMDKYESIDNLIENTSLEEFESRVLDSRRSEHYRGSSVVQDVFSVLAKHFPPRDTLIIQLYYIEGYSDTQIAQLLLRARETITRTRLKIRVFLRENSFRFDPSL